MSRFNEAEDACFLPKEGDRGVTAVQDVVAVPSVLHKREGSDGVRVALHKAMAIVVHDKEGGRSVSLEPAVGARVE